MLETAFRALLVLVFLTVSTTTGRAQEDVNNHVGPIASQIVLGEDGPWKTSVEGGWLTMANSSASGAIRYVWGGLSEFEGVDFSARMTVFARDRGDEPADAGFIFNFASPEQYLAITISSDGGAYIWQRTKDGLNVNAAKEVKARLDGSDELEIRVVGGVTELHLNGDLLFSLEFGSPMRRNIGIIASGLGVAAFTDMSVVPLDTQPDLPTPGGDGGDTLPTPGGTDESRLPEPGAGETGDATTSDTAGGGDVPPPIPTGDDTPPPIPTGAGSPPPIPTGGGASTGLALAEADIRKGVTMGIFLHEFAHAVIGETGLPATGPEEDIADSFSAFSMAAIAQGAPPEAQGSVLSMVKASALLWYYSALAQQAQPEVGLGQWQGEHAPNIKRFRNSFCVLYGSSPTSFDTLAKKVNFGPRAEARCADEYPRKFQAWEELLELRGRDLGPDMPGKYPADHPGGKIVLTFVLPTTQFGRETETILKSDAMLTATVDLFERYFVWPRDLQVTFRDCEQMNAWYDPSAGSVTMCYSVIAFFSQYVRDGLSAS